MRMRTAFIAAALAGLSLAAPSEAKKFETAAFKLLSASGTQTQTFYEKTTDLEYPETEDLSQTPTPTRVDVCTGTQSQSVRYQTSKPTKMYVTLRAAHGLHTLISDKPDPDSGLDYLSTAGEMTLSRSFSYETIKDCYTEPVECPESTFPNPVLVFGNHEPSAGITPAYDTNVDLPSGLAQDCSPDYFPKPPRDQLEFLGAIPRSQIFGKKKRLSGKDSYEFSWEQAADTSYRVQRAVAGTYAETIAVELKRLKPKRK